MYADRHCGAVQDQVTVAWTVERGVLTSTAPNSNVMRDEVLAIDDKRMTLHSLDDGTTYTRERVAPCP